MPNRMLTGSGKDNIYKTQIFNCDETPPFINDGVDGTYTVLVYAGKADACQKMPVREGIVRTENVLGK